MLNLRIAYGAEESKIRLLHRRRMSVAHMQVLLYHDYGDQNVSLHTAFDDYCIIIMRHD